MASGFEATEKILLYYPTIDIPSPSWIRQGLMYWDKIGSIVPDSYDAHLPRDLRYSDQLQPLYNAKLFHPYNPSDLFNKGWEQNAFGEFRAELLKILDSEDFQKKLSALESPKFDTELYPEKINDSLYQDLLDRKLIAERKNYDDKFIYFEKNTSLVYMAILAKYLANIDKEFTIPSTDLREYERLNLKGESESELNKDNPFIRIEFKDLLRVPADDVEIERVIEFRQKHNDKLLNFRQQILDKFEDEIKKCTEKKEVQDKTIRFKSQIERGVSELNQLLVTGRFQTVRGTLKTILKPQNITTGLALGGIATAAGGVLPGVVAGLAGGAIIEIYDYLVSSNTTRTDKLRTNAYSYLYLAESELKPKPKDKSGLISLNLSN